MTGIHLTWAGLGLAAPVTVLHTAMFTIFWTGVLTAYTPTAEWVADKLFAASPKPGRHPESMRNLALAIARAWALDAFLQEIVLRGIVVGALRLAIGNWPAVATAATLAFAAHLVAGPRRAAIAAQLSVLYGVLFVASEFDLWAVILAHGFYDTIALVQQARRKPGSP
ncbi:MAG: CPBP family intramembrane metalloprotease [Alphaproteobacteria bacterium]|nr:CPBP family intramembrane metalloprotease [Alphaproteobacteria bacterium]